MSTDKGHSKNAKSTTEASTQAHSAANAYQVGWAAGFLDGEGCIHIAKQRYRTARSDTYRLGVCVSQNDLDSLEHFRDVVGIKVPIFPVKLADNHRRQCYTLNYSGKRAVQLIALLSPHLRRKRAEAQAALDFWVDGRAGERPGGKGVDPLVVATRERYFQLLKQLK